MARFITSADAVVMLAVDGVYTTPQQIQGFMPDRAWENDAVQATQTQLGVDAILSAGWVPRTTKMVFSVMPDSFSSDFFTNWLAAQDANRTPLPAQGTLKLPSLGLKWTLTTGYLDTLVQIPNAAKVLEGRPFGIIWQTITVGPN